METTVEPNVLRPVISWSLAVCLAVAVAPWLSGGQEPVGQLISAFALLTGTVLAWRQPAVRQLKFGPLVASYLALVAWAGLSLIWSANRYSSVEWLVGLVLAGVAFRLAYAVSVEPEGRWRLVWLYLSSAVGVVVYGLYLYLTSGYDRFTSSFYWPNPAAAYLIPAIFIAYDTWRRGGKWWYGALTIAFGTSFVLTDSRAAGLVLLLFAGIYLLCVSSNKRLWITFVFSVFASFGVAYGLLATRHELQPKAVAAAPGSRLTPASSGNLQSGSDRIRYLQSAVNIWEAHPILGTGAGTYGDVHPEYQLRVVSASTSAHNAYVQILPELGLIGVLLLFWLGPSLFIGGFRGMWHDPASVALWLGSVGLWLHFGLDIDAQYPALLMLAAALAGATYYQKPAYRGTGWRWPVAAMLVAVPVICLYLSDAWVQRGQAAQADTDYQTAAVDFAKAHSYLFYNPDILTAEGINDYALAARGDKTKLAGALALARSAEHSDRGDAQHWQLEGRVLELGGDSHGAQAAYRRALVIDPYNHPEYAYDLALSLAQTGHAADALSVADAMLAQYPPGVVANRSADPTIRANLAELAVLAGTIHLQAGDVAAARASSTQANGFDESDIRAETFASVLRHLPTGE